MLNLRHLHTITVSIEQAGEARQIAGQMTEMLRDRHRAGNARRRRRVSAATNRQAVDRPWTISP